MALSKDGLIMDEKRGFPLVEFIIAACLAMVVSLPFSITMAKAMGDENGLLQLLMFLVVYLTLWPVWTICFLILGKRAKEPKKEPK